MKQYLFGSLFLAALLPASAASTPLVLGQTYNTGYVGNTALGAGVSDLDFTVTGSVPGSAPFTNPVVAYPTPPEWVPVTGAQFVSPTENQTYSGGIVAGDPAGTYVYQATLDTNFNVPTMLTVSGAFAADDYATASVNGLYIGWTPGFTGEPAGYSETTPFSYTFTVDAGSLPVELDFTVYNKDDTTDGTAINPTGLLVSNLSFTDDSSISAPEPSPGSMAVLGLGVLFILRRFRSFSV